MDNPVTRRNPDHVVILVHGMGKALKGGTLQEWTQPLLQSLNDIALDYRDRDETDPEFRTLPPLIIDSADAVRESPNTFIRVLRANPRYKDDYASILITEASWGKDFLPATAGATYGWAWPSAVKVIFRAARLVSWNMVPQVAAKHVSEHMPWLRWILAVLVTILASPLIAVGLIVLGVLIVLTPIPAVGRLTGSFISLFADFLGDPETWQRKPLQAAAMRERVSHALLKWSGDPEKKVKATPVTVLAHSQGAAISAQVLLQGGVHAQNFICVGNGLPLLGYARWGDFILRKHHKHDESIFGAIGLRKVTPNPEQDPIRDWKNHASNLRWVNLWAKFDFVPAGPVGGTAGQDNEEAFKNMSTGTLGSDYGPEEHAIYNSSALIKDHIVYSKNRIEVIDPVAQLIFRDCAIPPEKITGDLWLPPLATGNPIIDTRMRVHQRMVKCLGLGRVLAFTAGALLSWQLLSNPAVTETLFRLPLVNMPQMQWFRQNDELTWLTVTALLGVIILQILNRWLWVLLHGRVERRRTSDGKPVEAVGQECLVLNLAAVFLLSVAVPAAVVTMSAAPVLVGLPLIWILGYVGLFAVLVVISLAGRPVKPLPARVPPPPASKVNK
ncbi:hypothetical protein [Arthrobacter glacialis]|uniref:hypothetical protein n=1 Tax=Arthrobacter glacialis TaxID=1664 RepID=UPI001056EC7D|nr:hypothetical protein [Arthrobacter glacialis]